MPGVVRQEQPGVMDHKYMAASDFVLASRGDEFFWDGSRWEIDMSDLDCPPMLVIGVSNLT
jgi:hypothetical protein